VLYVTNHNLEIILTYFNMFLTVFKKLFYKTDLILLTRKSEQQQNKPKCHQQPYYIYYT